MDEPVRHNVTGLPTWSGSFSDGGQSYTYTMVGADPATGTSTTIPVTFIPIIFKIGTVTFDPTQNVNQFPANEITLLEQSPIFTPYPISAGPTNLGTSQGAKTNCCILGFHSQDGNFTYGTAAFNDPGEFTGSPIEDIEVITHEIGEAVDDPTGGNAVPAWGNIGQVAGCQSNLEVGDPVTGVITTIPGTNGSSYHPEDLVFVNWFSRTSPSPSVNGWYTFLNTFAGDAKASPPGGSN